MQLKHLTQYYPYKLRGIINNDGIVRELYNLNIGSLETKPRKHGYTYCGFKDFKPILRPLSDLTVGIEWNGKKTTPLEELKEIYNNQVGDIRHIKYHNLDYFTLYGLQIDDSYEVSIPYFMYEKLFKWHFDVFGLIAKGLAIDKNTLT